MAWRAFFAFLVIIVVIATVGWIVYTQVRARRAGLPPPSWKSYIPFTSASTSTYRDSSYPTPRSGGPIGWIKDRIARLRNRRTHDGAYEGQPAVAPQRGYRGAADHDEPWDTRVGNDHDTAYGPPGYYESQELGMAPRGTPYDGAGYEAGEGGSKAGAGNTDTMDRDLERGRSRSREPSSSRPETRGTDKNPQNPFGDHAEGSNLRDVSPRPEREHSTHRTSGESSRTARKSVFREGV